jgi:hypothetical protein
VFSGEKWIMTQWRRLGVLLGVLSCYDAMARDYFVSTTGNDDNSGASSSLALRTFAAASDKAAPGDVIRVLPGTYDETIKPTRSGMPGKPISYLREGASAVVITPKSAGMMGLHIEGVSHIVVDGINVDGVQPGPNARLSYFAFIKDANNIVIRNCNFRYANAYQGVHVHGESSYITIEDCAIDWNGLYDSGDEENSDWGDLVSFEESVHHVLIQRNRLTHGPHNVLVVVGDYGIIQDNVLDNTYADVFGGDAGGRPGALVGSNNVYQRNVFLNAGRSSDAPNNSFTKFEGTLNIARFNVFAYGSQEGVQSEAGYWTPITYDNRMYNNTFYRMGAGAWRVLWYDTGEKIGNNKFVNNIVVDSRMAPYKPSFDNDITIAVKGYGGGELAGNEVLSNMFSPHGGKAPIIYIYDQPGNIDLKTAETSYPKLFRGNVWKRPTFASSSPKSARDFDLQPGSPGIDEGMFVTTVVGSGTSDRVQVADSKFFIDGFGLIPGDIVRLQGSSATARIVSIDHSTRTLQLAEPLTFTAGQGIAPNYSGNAPDMGGRESGAAAGQPPSTATTPTTPTSPTTTSRPARPKISAIDVR